MLQYFGFGLPEVQFLIQDLPNADKCTKYQRKQKEDEHKHPKRLFKLLHFFFKGNQGVFMWPSPFRKARLFDAKKENKEP